MTELQKKVFREVFVGKAVRYNNIVEFNMIKRFYYSFNVGNLDFEYNIYQRVIKLNDNLNAYYLGDIIGAKKFTFVELEWLYRIKVEARKNKKYCETVKALLDTKHMVYAKRISGIRETVKPLLPNKPLLPTKIAFRNNTTTLVYDNFKVVRAKASNKDEAVRETGLLVALLKALNVKDYNTIIANAWDSENELTRHFYLYGVVQQLYVDKELLSRNQFNKLFEAVGDKKPNVNIGGKIIELEYK